MKAKECMFKTLISVLQNTYITGDMKRCSVFIKINGLYALNLFSTKYVSTLRANRKTHQVSWHRELLVVMRSCWLLPRALLKKLQLVINITIRDVII